MPVIKYSWSALVAVLVAFTSVLVLAHSMTLKGTVAAVDRAHIQIKTGEEKKGEALARLTIDDKTKIFRGKMAVTFEVAKIAVDEKAVVLVDHESDAKMMAVEIHLAQK